MFLRHYNFPCISKSFWMEYFSWYYFWTYFYLALVNLSRYRGDQLSRNLFLIFIEFHRLSSFYGRNFWNEEVLGAVGGRYIRRKLTKVGSELRKLGRLNCWPPSEVVSHSNPITQLIYNRLTPLVSTATVIIT